MGHQFWLAVAAYLVPTFPLGYLWHLTTFREQYARLEIYRPQVIIPFGLASMFLQALLFAWIYPRLFSTGHSAWLRSATAFGVTLGLIAWSFTTLSVAAKYRMASVRSFLLLESAFTAVQFAIISPLIALAYRTA